MSKLSLAAFSQRADQIATDDLLNSINGGTENCCHPADCVTTTEVNETVLDNIPKVEETRLILKEN